MAPNELGVPRKPSDLLIHRSILVNEAAEPVAPTWSLWIRLAGAQWLLPSGERCPLTECAVQPILPVRRLWRTVPTAQRTRFAVPLVIAVRENAGHLPGCGSDGILRGHPRYPLKLTNWFTSAAPSPGSGGLNHRVAWG